MTYNGEDKRDSMEESQRNVRIESVTMEMVAATLPALVRDDRHNGESPPPNFGHVSSNNIWLPWEIVGNHAIYRCSFPKPDSFNYLKKLKLKTILTLVKGPYDEKYLKFMKENGIRHISIPMNGNKEPFNKIEDEEIAAALHIVLNPENAPILIHCNKGKHRTGCVVGCLRRLQNWALTSAFDEYWRFANPKQRNLDFQFIENFDERLLGHIIHGIDAEGTARKV